MLIACQTELKRSKSVNKKIETDKKEIKAELQASFKRLDEIKEENGKLKAEIVKLRQTIEADNELLARANDKKIDDNPEIILNNKTKGYRRQTPVEEAQPAGNMDELVCPICKFKVKEKRQMKSHKEIHPDKYDACCEVFETAGLLRRHLKNSHDKSIPIEECNKCNYKANSESQVKNHMKIKHTEVEINQNIEENVCNFFLRNACRFGNQCQSEHPVLCRFQDSCRNRSNCNFYHNETLMKMMRCRYQSRCSRFTCKFTHEQQTWCRYQENCSRPNCYFVHSFLGSGKDHNLIYHKESPNRGQQRQAEEVIQMWRPWDL